MPKPTMSLTLAAAVLLAAARPSWGWIDTGHKVVALVAWADLTPAARAAVTDILKAHPRYEKDLLSGGQLEPTPPAVLAAMTPDDLDRRAFTASAVWPDLIKNQGHPMRVQYGHSPWHYIDIPYVPPTTQPVELPATREADAAPGPHNVVEALNACVAELKDPATKPDQRAVDVCWIVHLVGDIHQPLHCATEYDAQFPKGDQGGNNQVVLRDGRYPDTREKLHLLWDSLPGDFASDEMDRYEAMGLRADPKYDRAALAKELAQPADFMAWARASHQMAVDDVYLDGRLRSAAALPGRGAVRTSGAAPGLPPGYLDKAEHDAMHQVALAGYRLADLLNATLDPKK